MQQQTQTLIEYYAAGNCFQQTSSFIDGTFNPTESSQLKHQADIYSASCYIYCDAKLETKKRQLFPLYYLYLQITKKAFITIGLYANFKLDFPPLKV